MAYQAFDLWIPAPQWQPQGPPSFTSINVDASGEKFGNIIRVPKTGTLHSFEQRIGSVTQNPVNGTRYSFQDVSLTTGVQDGVVDQFRMITTLSADAWNAPPGPLTDDGTDTGVKRSVSQGDLLACVVDVATFTAGDSFQANCLQVTETVLNDFYITDDANIYTSEPNIALKYDDGTYAILPWLIGPYVTLTTRSFNTGSTPDERGVRFTVPIACQTDGAWLRIGTTGDYSVVLYDGSSSVLATGSTDKDVKTVAAGNICFVYWNTTVTLTPGNTYRVVCKPTTATNVDFYEFTVQSNAYLATLPGGIDWYGTSRTDAGAWTDANDTRYWMGLHLTAMNDTGGAVATIRPFAAGFV
jgi:hypothetical protein